MHLDITGGNVGRPDEKVTVLNKAGFVLVCAFWQSYCEEVLFEILLAYKKGKSRDVPTALRVALGNKALRDQKNIDPLTCWSFTGAGWRAELQGLVDYLMGDKSRPLDAPTSDNIDTVFLKYLGVRDLSSRWYWAKMSAEQARTKLNDAITRRHRLAHRGRDTASTRKKHVTDFSNHVKRLAGKTETVLRNEKLIK